MSIAPQITPQGIVIHDFAACRDWLRQQFRSIYGEDVYLGSDSQDGQWLDILARAFADCNAAAAAVYNAFSPATAQGAGLSSVVKINGLRRALPSSSTCPVRIIGTAETTITNGEAIDTAGHTWRLPATVTIPSAGEITVTATCATPGAIQAAPGAINRIKTPVFGWQSVLNQVAATPGSPVETDAALRLRQSRSVAGPSTTILEGVRASIAQLSGVSRLRYYENNSDEVDGHGLPARSVAFFAEGGDELEIAQAIGLRMTPGTALVGDIVHTVMTPKGSSRVVRFARPTAAEIKVALTIEPLTGWSSEIEPIIASAVAEYVNSLSIGDTVRYFDVSRHAQILGSPYATAFSLRAMTMAKGAGSPNTSDIALNFDEAPICTPANVTITVQS